MFAGIIASMEIDILSDETDSYYEEQFVGLIITGEWIRSKEFEDCRFESCRFTECNFFECAFLECRFEDCLMSATQVSGCSFIDAQFTECKLVGIDWTQGSNVRGLVFSKCTLDYSVFSPLKLKGLKLLNCVCKEADFREADLTDGNFEGTDFDRSVFSQTNLTNANFEEARNYSIDPRVNVLKRAKFSMPEAMSLLKSFDVTIVNSKVV